MIDGGKGQVNIVKAELLKLNLESIKIIGVSKDYNEVICFEPLKKHIECHKKNCEGLKNITLHECALSNKNEYRQITTKDRNSGMTTLEPNISNRWSSKTKKVELVKTKILDDFNFGKIDFIKLDVEGHEISV